MANDTYIGTRPSGSVVFEDTQLGKLRSLYDIRNAIVHGGFEVSHPMHNGALDKRVDENYARLSEAADYGYAILLASIQKIILNGWRFPKFQEAIGGEPI
jgi:hypothetical protein